MKPTYYDFKQRALTAPGQIAGVKGIIQSESMRISLVSHCRAILVGMKMTEFGATWTNQQNRSRR